MHRKTIIFLIIPLFIVYSLLSILASDNIYDAFDLNCGAIAKNVIDRSGLPITFFLWPTYRGQLLSSLLTVPIFLIFGDSFFSLKLMAFFLASLMLFFLYRLTARFFNKKIALATSLLFIFPNQFLLQQLMATCGQHTISILFILITLYYFFFLLNKEEPIQKYLFLLGISSGLGISISFNFLSTFFLIMVLLLTIFKNTFFTRRLLFLGIGLIFGLLPLIILRLNKVNIFDIQDKPLFAHFSHFDTLNALKRFIKIIGPTLKNSFQYSDLFFLSGKLITLFLYCLFILSFLGTAFSYCMSMKSSKKPTKEMVIPLYILFYIFFYALSDLEINFPRNYDEAKFLVILHPFLYLMLFIWCTKFESKPIVRIFNKTLLILLIILGISTQCHLIEWRDLKRQLRYKGYAFWGVMNLGKNMYLKPIFLKPTLDNLKNLNPLIKLDIIQKLLTAFKIRRINVDYYLLLQKYLDKEDLAAFIECQVSHEILNTVTEDYKGTIEPKNNLGEPYLSYAYSVIGEMNVHKNLPKLSNPSLKDEGALYAHLLKSILFLSEGLSPLAKAGYLEGFGRAVGIYIFDNKEIMNQLTTLMVDDQKKNFFKGMGESFLFKPGIALHPAQIEKKAILIIGVSFLPNFFEGMGRTILKTYLWDSNKCLNELDRLSKENRKYAYKGLAEGLHLFFRDKNQLQLWLKYLNHDDKQFILSLYDMF